MSSFFIDLRWNSKGAIVGKFARTYGPFPEVPEPFSESKWNCHGLTPFAYFLAVPFIDLSSLDVLSVRFGYAYTSLANKSLQAYEFSSVVSAFAHYAFVKNGRELIFADLQGMFVHIFLMILIADGARSVGVILPGPKCLLFDPQISTKKGNAAQWDCGPFMVNRFLERHMCSRYCEKL